jgi:hypothetical protein
VPARRVTLDVFHVEVRVPVGVPQGTADAMSRVLRSAAFRRRLRRAAVRAVRRHPELAPATVRVT